MRRSSDDHPREAPPRPLPAPDATCPWCRVVVGAIAADLARHRVAVAEMDADGGMCPSCVRYQVGDLRGPSAIRELLLALPRDDRPAAFLDAGICDACGDDLMAADGTVRYCYCENDE